MLKVGLASEARSTMTTSTKAEGRRVRERKIALQNIQNREQEHPHDINKVPIKAGALEEPMLLGRDVTGECSDQTNNQEDHADGDVTAVKSGEHEKAAAHDPRRIEPESFVKEVLPFIGLVAEEEAT